MKIFSGPGDLLSTCSSAAGSTCYRRSNHARYQPFAVLIAFLAVLNSGAQQRSLMSDPTITAAMRAQREGRTADAEKILVDAIQTAKQTEPPNPRLVFYLKALSTIYSSSHESSKALEAAQEILQLDQQTSGEDGPAAIADTSNIAIILEQQGKNDEAEQLLRHAVDVVRQSPNPNPRLIVQAVGNLGALYSAEKRWAEAETLLEDALKNCRESGIPQICRVLSSTLNTVYNNENRLTDGVPPDSMLPPELAALERTAQQYTDNGIYLEAETTYREAISWIEQHPKVPLATSSATILDLSTRLPREYDLLGHVLQNQGLNSEAEASFKKELELSEANVNPKQPMTATGLNFSGLLNLYRSEQRLSEIEPIIAHILMLQEQLLGPNSLRVADTLLSLARIYSEEQKYGEAVPLYERTLIIQEANLGPDKRQLLPTLTAYAIALRALHEDAQAASVDARIESIRTNH